MSLGCELDSKVSSGILEEMYHLAKSTSNALCAGQFRLGRML